jgi:hypothetical protein
MGEILQSLGLLGGGTPEGGVPMGDYAPDPRSGDPLASLLQPAQAGEGEGEPIEVVGDPWMPKKQSFLKKLGDIVLERQGYAPQFKNELDEENIRGAMEGFTSDPLRSIQRIRRIKGQSGTAWKMYGDHLNHERDQTAIQKEKALLQEKLRDRIAAQMGALTPENSSKLYPLIKKAAESRGITDLPEKYDPDEISLWRSGGMTVDQQEDNERDEDYDATRLSQFSRSIEQRGRYQEERLDDFDEDQEETVRHHKATEGAADAREQRLRAKTPGLGKRLVDKNTGKEVGTVLPSGKYAMVERGGKTLVFKVLPGGGIKYDPKKTAMVNDE